MFSVKPGDEASLRVCFGESAAALDGNGYFDSDESCVTKTEGIFIAGDCRKKTIRQLTTAVCDGTVAALAAMDYLKELA